MSASNEAIALTGVRETRKALRAASPDIVKELDREIRKVTKAQVDKARNLMPMEPPLSGMTKGKFAWDVTKVRSALKFKKRSVRLGRGYRTDWNMRDDSAAGSLFEMAGRRSMGKTPQGQNFVRMVQQRFGAADRVLWRVLDNGGTRDVQEAVKQAYEAAEAKIQKALD